MGKRGLETMGFSRCLGSGYHHGEAEPKYLSLRDDFGSLLLRLEELVEQVFLIRRMFLALITLLSLSHVSDGERYAGEGVTRDPVSSLKPHQHGIVS